METLEILQIVWFFIIGFFLIGYSILDGFDLGIGTLFPFLAKNEEESKKLFSSIGPVWDGNEVWIITGGAALFAAFPNVYATVFSGFYLALMLLLFGLIFRAVSIEFWLLHTEGRPVWKWAFTIGSLLPSLLFGVALGNVIIGIPLDELGNYTGSFFFLLRPFPLGIGLLGLVMIMLQGLSYGILKTDGDLQIRIRNLASRIWVAYAVLFVAATTLTAIFIPGSLSNIISWIFAALVIVSLGLYKLWLEKGEDFKPLVASSLSIIFLWGIVGSQLFPNMVRATVGENLTIYNSSSQTLTLTVMLIIAVIGMPIVITYTTFAYRIFKGKV